MIATVVSTGSGLMALGGIAGLAAFGKKAVDFAKQVANLPGATRDVVTQMLAWAAGIGVTFAFAASRAYGQSIQIGADTLHRADTPTKLMIGLAIGSGMSIGNDLIKAIDSTQSAKIPSLPVGPTPPVTHGIPMVQTDPNSPIVIVPPLEGFGDGGG